GDVDIHYVLPTTPASELIRFSHLRTNYLHCLPGWPLLRQEAPRSTSAELVDNRIEDDAQGGQTEATDGGFGREKGFEQRPFGVSEIRGIEQMRGIHPPSIPDAAARLIPVFKQFLI